MNSNKETVINPNEMNEILCRYLCTTESDEPHDKQDIKDFKQRFLRNVEENGTTFTLEIVKKFKCEFYIYRKYDKELDRFIVVRDSKVIAFCTFTNTRTADTLSSDKYSEKILTYIGYDPNEMPDWQKYKKEIPYYTGI